MDHYLEGQIVRNSSPHEIALSGIVDTRTAYGMSEEGWFKWYRKLLDAGVEENGIQPVPPEERKETSSNKLFTVFFTCLLCIVP